MPWPPPPARAAGRFPASNSRTILHEVQRLAEGVILPRRLTIADQTGAHVTLLLRRRQLVGVASVAPPGAWHAAPLPMLADDDPASDDGPATAEAAAMAIADLLGHDGTLDMRLDFPRDDDDLPPEGLPLADLLDPLARLIDEMDPLPDRATLLHRFYDRMEGCPRLLIATDGTRHEALPDDTPDFIRTLFAEIGQGNIQRKAGDPPEVLVFEQGKSGNHMTVKIADETRLCLVHARTAGGVDALMAATWQMKTALEQASGGSLSNSAQ